MLPSHTTGGERQGDGTSRRMRNTGRNKCDTPDECGACKPALVSALIRAHHSTAWQHSTARTRIGNALGAPAQPGPVVPLAGPHLQRATAVQLGSAMQGCACIANRGQVFQMLKASMLTLLPFNRLPAGVASKPQQLHGLARPAWWPSKPRPSQRFLLRSCSHPHFQANHRLAWQMAFQAAAQPALPSAQSAGEAMRPAAAAAPASSCAKPGGATRSAAGSKELCLSLAA